MEFWVGIAQIVGALATAGALWVSFWNLKQVERQTDIISNPYLKLRILKFSEEELYSLAENIIIKNPILLETHSSWQRIISGNLRHQDFSDLRDEYLIIKLENVGKSEIVSILFNSTLTVEMFDNDVIPFPIKPDPVNLSFDITNELTENNELYLPIANIKYFPIFKLEINDLKYKDVRGKWFKEFNGPKILCDENELLIPKEIPSDWEEPDIEEPEDVEPSPLSHEEDDSPF
jgi:hypothetical protein